MKKALLVTMLALVAAGCDQYDKGSVGGTGTTTTRNTNNSTARTGANQAGNNQRTYDADNTGRNTRDNDFRAMASGGQTGANQAGNNQRAYDADNTGRNIRDSDFKTMTSGDQSESEEDRMITQEIRRAVVNDDNLSTNAKNIKIITVNRVVTLRGPVNSAKEKEEIARKASAVKGIRRVENYLEIIQKQ